MEFWSVEDHDYITCVSVSRKGDFIAVASCKGLFRVYRVVDSSRPILDLELDHCGKFY